MRNNQIAIRESEEAVETIGQLKHHQASVVKPANNDFTTPTLKGIKQFFKFKADKQKNIIYAFKDSSQKVHSKRFQPHDILEMDSIDVD